MKLTDKQIAEIAELLDCGLICFIHQPTGTIEYHPDNLDQYFDSEPWQETIDKIDDNWDDYERIDKMDSYSAFLVMEEFADWVIERKFKERLYAILNRPKPFSTFKAVVETSKYRQDWFDFKKEAYIDWVKKQIDN
jgi:hypothetical protein